MLRQSLLRSQLAAALTDGLPTPTTYARVIHIFQTEERVLRFVTLSPDSVPIVDAPSKAELAAYFTATEANWQAPETRRFDFIRLRPEPLPFRQR